MRGKHGFSGDLVAPVRIIPARAGQTVCCVVDIALLPEHPRACGGKRGYWRIHMEHDRIISARAGQTAQAPSPRPPPPDHPRACGANVDSRNGVLIVAGSSPRVRGKPCGAASVTPRVRIIPARAGQTPCRARVVRQWTDHSRACGANVPPSTVATPASGSSPRVRGKLLSVLERLLRIRIIPARAGQTRCWKRDCPERPDHPRACGANVADWAALSAVAGSSPRVRGKRQQPQTDCAPVRIIPARAGQTHPTSRRV